MTSSIPPHPADSDGSPIAVAPVPLSVWRLARIIGYGLMVLSFVDFLYILLPAEFLNPVWEYQFTGDLVKLIPVPLLACVLVFSGETLERHPRETLILRILSWLALGLSITFFLILPLTLFNTQRIHRFNTNQINSQVNQQTLQLEATRAQLEKATPEQLQSLVPTPNPNGQFQAPATPQEAKTQILKSIEQSKQQAADQAVQARANVRRNLIKNSLKLMAEAFLGGVMFFYTWWTTPWARRSNTWISPRPAQPASWPGMAWSKQLQRLLSRKPRRISYRPRR